MGEVRAQLKLAREQTLAVKLGAAEELTRLRGEAGAAERAVGKMQMEREIKDGMLAQQREQLGTLEAALRTARSREEAPPRELQPDAPEAATRCTGGCSPMHAGQHTPAGGTAGRGRL